MARRRANGEGCIRKRKDGTWEARITLGYDPFGKQMTKSVYGRTQRDVKEKLERLKVDLEGGVTEKTVQPDTDTGKDKKEVIEKEAENTGDGICMLTLEQWLDIWRKQYLSNVKPGTVCHYESVCRLHIVPALGTIPLVKLRTPAIQKFYIDLQEKGAILPCGLTTSRRTLPQHASSRASFKKKCTRWTRQSRCSYFSL